MRNILRNDLLKIDEEYWSNLHNKYIVYKGLDLRNAEGLRFSVTYIFDNNQEILRFDEIDVAKYIMIED